MSDSYLLVPLKVGASGLSPKVGIPFLFMGGLVPTIPVQAVLGPLWDGSWTSQIVSSMSPPLLISLLGPGSLPSPEGSDKLMY